MTEPFTVSDTLVLHVDAPPERVLAGVDRQLHREPFAGVEVLGDHRYGISWQPARGSRADLVWNVTVADDGEGGSFLSSTRTFIAHDERARATWPQVRRNAHALAHASMRALKREVEQRLTLEAFAAIAA